MLDAGVSEDLPLQLARTETDHDAAYNAYIKAQRPRTDARSRLLVPLNLCIA
jgi:hypothetical protein